METYDVIIIGGGPAGLSAAIYSGRAERQTLLIEKGNFGGRVNDTLEIRNYPGTISDSGSHLMETFREHAQSYALNSFKRTTVTGIDRKEDGSFLVHTKRKGDFSCNSVILDMGTRPRVLGIPNEVELRGHGVAYCATCDAEFFKDQVVYVLGAGDQAIEESGYLSRFAKSVTVIVLHEEGHLDCNEIAAEEAFKNPKINFVWNTTLQAIKGGDKVEGLELKNIVSGQVREVEADGIFFFVGMVPQTEFVKDLVDCDAKGYILTNEMMETSIPGIYAVGDCTRTYLRQIVTAAADGAIAATASERYVTERRQLGDILRADSGKVAFLFYNPYESAQIDQVSSLEKKLCKEYKVYRQDITRQALLFKLLHMEQTVSAAMFEGGKLVKKSMKDELKED